MVEVANFLENKIDQLVIIGDFKYVFSYCTIF
jgi:hypothetical protein